MPRESKKAIHERALLVIERLTELYPDARSALDFSDPFTLTIAVLLSAQTTDAQVNKVTPELFRRWPDAASMASANPTEVAEVIKSTGFYQVKAKHCVQAAQMIISEFDGQIPQTMQQFTRLPGVGRKTANIVLHHAFSIVSGIAVDTHVFRIAHRLNLVDNNATTAGKVEQALMRVYPHEYWGYINSHFILFGREFCKAKAPLCASCPLAELCRRNEK